MKIVIDTNVLMAGLLKDSIVRAMLLSKNIKFFIPEHALDEIRKYEDELLKKSGYAKKQLKSLMNYLLENVKIIPSSITKNHLKKVESIMKNIDIKDSSFIAAVFSINADGIWSYDNHFKKQDKVKVFSIEELIEKF